MWEGGGVMLAKPEKMKIVGDVKKSNDRMSALLVDVCTTAAVEPQKEVS
jgi:hypothetical protein